MKFKDAKNLAMNGDVFRYSNAVFWVDKQSDSANRYSVADISSGKPKSITRFCEHSMLANGADKFEWELFGSIDDLKNVNNASILS